MLGDDVVFASVREQGALLRARKIGAMELTEAYLQRLESTVPRLAAVVTVTRELALAQAHRAQQEMMAGRYRGPLHGIPYGAKDLLATKGIPTTWGAAPFRTPGLRPRRDGRREAPRRRRDPSGKARDDRAGGRPRLQQPRRQLHRAVPHSLEHRLLERGFLLGLGPATAAGLVAFALGSETSGSILNPAANCGLSGLRPTYGLVSRHGAMALSWTLDKLGPLCRTADDCGLVLSVIAGTDPRDPSTEGEFAYRLRGAEDGGPARRFRVGLLTDATLGAEPEVRDNFLRAVDVLRTFAAVDEVAFPDLPFGAAVDVIVSADAASAFRAIIESGAVKQLQDPADRLGGFASMMTLAVDYVDAMRLRVKMRAALDDLLSRYDALIAPTYGGTAEPIGYDFDKPPGPAPTPPPENAPRAPATVPAGNLAGLPALCVPMGLGRNGLPTSLQFLGRAFSEQTLLALADRYQQATEWHLKRPPAPRA